MSDRYSELMSGYDRVHDTLLKKGYKYHIFYQRSFLDKLFCRKGKKIETRSQLQKGNIIVMFSWVHIYVSYKNKRMIISDDDSALEKIFFLERQEKLEKILNI